MATAPSPLPVAPTEPSLSAQDIAQSHASTRCPSDASPEEQQFCEAAARAVYATYEDDSDDAAPLLGLFNALETKSSLSRLDGVWRAALHAALSRAQTLAHLARPLRQLKRAVSDAFVDPRTGLYRGVDTAGCREAFVALSHSDVEWQELQVTLEPLGSYTLSTFRRFCLESRTLEPNR